MQKQCVSDVESNTPFLAYVFSSVIYGIRDIFLEIGVSDLFLRTLFDQERVSSLSSLTHYERQLNRLRRLNMRAEKLSSANTALSCVFVSFRIHCFWKRSVEWAKKNFQFHFVVQLLIGAARTICSNATVCQTCVSNSHVPFYLLRR